MTEPSSDPVKFIRSVHSRALPLVKSDPATQKYINLKGAILQQCEHDGFDCFHVIPPYDARAKWLHKSPCWRFGFEAFGAGMRFDLMSQDVDNLLVNIRTCIEESNKALQLLDRHRTATFLVEKRAVYPHGVFGVHTDLDAAIQHCKECAHSDSDDHHEWSVLLFDGNSNPESDATHTMMFECSNGDWEPEAP